MQILPSSSRGSRLGEQLSQGLQKGVSSGLEFAQKLGVEKYKKEAGLENYKKFKEMQRGGSQGLPPEQKNKAFLEFLPQLENLKREQTGEDLTTEEIDKVWENFDQIHASTQPRQAQENDPFAEAEFFAATGDEPLARVASERARTQSKQEFARETKGEDKLQEMEGKLEAYEQSGMRFNRLNNLFSSELEDKFPPSLLAAALTENGELRPTALATLSPEAQESLKLVTDEIKGAKDTFGARVTNFDAQTYLKTLPTLLNTPEGRRRVLRDLRIMNQLNQMHEQGVLGIVDRYGGPGKISISKAEREYKKKNAKKIQEYRNAFVNSDEFPFSELDNFNASIFPGVTIEDPETGQEFTSNGQTWEMD